MRLTNYTSNLLIAAPIRTARERRQQAGWTTTRGFVGVVVFWSFVYTGMSLRPPHSNQLRNYDSQNVVRQVRVRITGIVGIVVFVSPMTAKNISNESKFTFHIYIVKIEKAID